MNQYERNIKKLKSELLSILEYSNDVNEYMPDRIVNLIQEHSTLNNIKNELGYSALPVNLSHITKLNNDIQSYTQLNDSLQDKVKFFCDQEDISNSEKFIQLESLLEVIRPKNNKVKEKSIYLADNEMNFVLNKFKSKLNKSNPEHLEKIEFINTNINDLNQKNKNKKKASL